MKTPKIKTVEEAIKLDNELEYMELDKEAYDSIHTRGTAEDMNWFTDDHERVISIPEKVVDRILKLKVRDEGYPRLIVYDNKALQAVSAIFKRIPLEDVWKEATEVLGQPIKQIPISGAIICQFNMIFDTTDIGGEEAAGKHDYKLYPVIRFSYNFKHKSFAFGHMAEIMFCSNQMYKVDISRRIVHNVYMMKEFTIKKTVKEFAEDYKALCGSMGKAMKVYITMEDELLYYWLAARGANANIARMLEHPAAGSVWEAIMNITNVASHTKGMSRNTAYEISKIGGDLLEYSPTLADYTGALSHYLKHENDDFYKDRAVVQSLEVKVLEILQGRKENRFTMVFEETFGDDTDDPPRSTEADDNEDPNDQHWRRWDNE